MFEHDKQNKLVMDAQKQNLHVANRPTFKLVGLLTNDNNLK